MAFFGRGCRPARIGAAGGACKARPEKTRSVDPAARCAGPVDSTSRWARASSIAASNIRGATAAILILIFGGLRAWASRYIRKGVRRSRREWWWLGEGEREKQI